MKLLWPPKCGDTSWQWNQQQMSKCRRHCRWLSSILEIYLDGSAANSRFAISPSDYCSQNCHINLRDQKADKFVIALPFYNHIIWSDCPSIPILIVITLIDFNCNVLHQQVSQEAGSDYRSPRALRPQLGLGAVTRQPAAKTKPQQTGQKSATAPKHSAQAARVTAQGSTDAAGKTVIWRHNELRDIFP